MKPLVALVGPTAVGKSEAAIYLAQRVDGEIVNADSRQVYRYMDVGTAKPSAEDRALVRHHLIDLTKPDEEFSLAVYRELALQAISDIQERGKLPILVGGSGLYVWAVLEGWRIPPVPADKQLRHELSERAQTGNSEILYNELLRVDPQSASAIGPTNTRRIIRALEVFYVTGTPMSELQRKEAPGFQTLIVGLTAPRSELYRRIDRRVEDMMCHGLVEETRALLKMGYTLDLPAMSGIGYKQIALHLRGELELDESVRQIEKATRNLARHQYGWFRLTDRRIRWFDVELTDKREILELVAGWLAGLRRECPVAAT